MKTVNVSVDFNNITGKIKPMHGIGQPPLTGIANTMLHYLKEAGIPYSRLHDVGGPFGQNRFVDIPNIFRNFDADENDPESYDFTFTDIIIEGLMKVDCEPYFRLGVTIETAHRIKAYRIFPPKDFEKWARICEHIIRHYNEGWADGYHFAIRYWEIWNEPDSCIKDEIAAMWKGTAEEYYRLYSVTSRHLKACFGDGIRVGGYASCGMHEYASDTELEGVNIPVSEQNPHQMLINFMHGFFKYQKETDAPIDFFSWHIYETFEASTRGKPREIINHADYVRRVLDKYGYTATESHINEWNNWCDKRHRDSHFASAKTLGFMLMMQDAHVDVMCYYDGKLGYSDYAAIINPDNGYPYRNYYAFAMFNTLYRLNNEVKTSSDDENVYVGAAVNGRKAALVISNNNTYSVEACIDVKKFSVKELQILRIDEGNRYTLTGEGLENGKITVPDGGCVEIKLWDI